MLKKRLLIIIFSSVVLFALLFLFSYIMAMNVGREKSYGSGSIEVNSDGNGIGENTIITFVYNYADGVTQAYDSVPAMYMQGWGRERLASAYDKWTMESYSPKKVIFSKNVQKNSPYHYVLKELDGYIAVYDADNTVKEVTSANISSFDEEEKEKYIKGIDVLGNEKLASILQDLES
jgi:hypothetical protein